MGKQTAGRTQLGDFAPKFAELNDDILFGEVWSREEKLSLRDRSIITVSILMAKGITDSSLEVHITNAKKHGISADEMAEILTHAAFYAGWPNAWAAFRIAKKVYEDSTSNDEIHDPGVFGLGEPNDAYKQYFIGQSYLKRLSKESISIANVTFEPRCRNNWHIHQADKGGGQILLVTGGRGFYQEWGKPVQKLFPGDVVNIGTGIKHWHGAANDSWFSHLSIEVPGEGSSNEWLEPVLDEEYDRL